MRTMLKKILMTFLYAVYRVLDPIFHFQDVSILTYHSISDSPIDTAVEPSEFEKQLAYLKEKGHSFVSLKEVVDCFTKGTSLGGKSVAITFDDGYADFETHALPILSKYNAPATIFVMSDEAASRPRLGNDIPMLSEEALERLKNNPQVEIGFHGKTHANVRNLTGADLQDEMKRPEGIRFFAFAGGSYTRDAIDIARKEGYAAACSIKPGLITKRSEQYLLQRNVITRSMTPHDVEFRTTRAIEWYARGSRWFK